MGYKMTNEEFTRTILSTTENLARFLIVYVDECDRYRSITGVLYDKLEDALQETINWLKEERK